MEEETNPRDKPEWWREAPDKPVETMPGKNGGTLLKGDYGQGKLGGYPKGKKNRSTILKHYMNLRISQQIALTGETKVLPLESHMELEMLAAILQDRNPVVYKEVKDTVYGKLTDNLNVTGDVDLSHAIQFNIGFEEPNKDQPTDGT